METALPYLLGIQAVTNTVQALSPPKPPPRPKTLSWEQAMQQAQTTLNPLYDQALQDTLQNVALQNIRSGFFGQAPGSAISQDAAARLEGQRASGIGNLASQLVGRSLDDAYRQQALAAEYQLNQLRGQQSAFSNLASTTSNLAQLWPTVFNIPNIFGTLSAGQEAMENMPGIVQTSTPATAHRLQPSFGNMGIANQTGFPRLNFNQPRTGTMFNINPYAG